MADKADPDILDEAQAGALCGYSRHTMYMKRRTATGPAFIKLPGGRIRYRRRDVEAWLEAHRIGGQAA